ncbi:MAG: DUF4157 domain-containing protein, partial [Moorea sp. SIO4A1]|uniref:eCIS core domain-containing protein n=1 Tax=Moorena sp. SIO4A1 TaxID=2607835 RepID=UPI00144F28B7
STSLSIAQKKKDERRNGLREILDAEERDWNAENAVGEWGSMSANVMRTLESGEYQPETGRREMGRQGKFSFGQPGERSWQGANNGGQLVVQPKRMMVQRRAQPLTGDSVTYGDSMRASRSKKENKTGLPDRLKAGIENLSGYSMDDVRVHYNSSKPAQLQALAYAQGTDIHVGPGQEMHLPHEAWHVVQQMQGRVKPTWQVNGMSINREMGLEHEADLMGSVSLTMVEQQADRRKSKLVGWSDERVLQSPVIQRKVQKFEAIESKNYFPPGFDLSQELEKVFSQESMKIINDKLSNSLLKTTQSLIEVPVKVEAILEKDDDDVTPKRKTYKSGNIGKIGKNLYWLRTGTWERFEGGHLIPHALWDILDNDVESADDYINLVPMSSTMNQETWKKIEKEMTEKYNSLKEGEELKVEILIKREVLKLGVYDIIVKRLEIDWSSEDTRKNRIIKLYGWNPIDISSKIVNQQTGSERRNRVAENEAREPSRVIETKDQLIGAMERVGIKDRVKKELWKEIFGA